MLEAIIYNGGKLEILDQLKLPLNTCYETIESIKDGWDAIKLMKVRGAPAISIVAALSLAVELSKKDFDSKNHLHTFVLESLQFLATSRPTAVNLCRVVQLFTDLSEQFLKDDNISKDVMKEKTIILCREIDNRKKVVKCFYEGLEMNEDCYQNSSKIARLIAETEKLLASDIRINKAIGEAGGQYIVDHFIKPITILTHCNTGSLATAGYGTALGVIRWLHEKGYLHHVYCTETRPYNQGARLTAYELVHDGIPATLICDNMAASLMKSKTVSAVIVGADRVVSNGDTANKIGTYQLAVCAKYHHVPFLVACPRSTLDFNLSSGDSIPIEERPAHEMMTINSHPIAAEGINCWNPAFDVTPGELITGIITEIGVFRPKAIKQNIDKLSSMDLLK